MAKRWAGIALGALLLAGCGSKEQPPVEQIVVREPGQPGPAAATTADSPASIGKAAFAACSTCHAVNLAAAAGIGPNLHGVVGRKAGALEGFAYSDALKGSGLTWTEAELDAFLANPAAKVPGTTMAAGGVSDPARRKAIIAYLASLTG